MWCSTKSIRVFISWSAYGHVAIADELREAIKSGDLDISCTRNTILYSTVLGYADLVFIDLLTPTLYWPMVEASLGVVGACLRSMLPIFRKCAPRDGFWRVRDDTSFRSLFWFRKHSNSISSRKHLNNEASRSSLRPLPLDSRYTKDKNISTGPEKDAVCDSRW